MVVLALVLATASAVAAKPRAKAHHRKPKPVGSLVTVAPDLSHPGPPIQPGFIGLSFEASALPQVARYSDRGDFVTMLRSLGPGLLRFGGAVEHLFKPLPLVVG